MATISIQQVLAISSGKHDQNRSMSLEILLRAGGMKGFAFRRQRPVFNCTADFMCKELHLIIEVDGITHTYEGSAEKDIKRQNEIEEAGFTVIRFTDNEVLYDINNVFFEIEDLVIKIMQTKGISPRIPSRRG